MTYPEALSFLGEARRFGMKLGLDTMRDLARRLGDPQKNLRFIHIAGTNGKGSTAAFCESCLRAAGNRVGLYTSPHLVSVRERFQIDRFLISEGDFVEGMSVVRAVIAQMKTQEPTFFEITTALALWYFAKEKVDWVVWETGLGGRLDATNIVDPEVCIITNIGLEHQQYLGSTLAEIAKEKAGIIKPGVPVVSGVADGGPARIIEYQAKSQKCDFISIANEVNKEFYEEFPGIKGIRGIREGKQLACINHMVLGLGLLGMHQVFNAACAVTAIKFLDSQHCYEKPLILEEPEHWEGWGFFDSIWQGLEAAQWPGRFELLSEEPLTVLDGAHNPAGMEKLIETWCAFLASRKIDEKAHLIFASVADKDISEMAQMLRPLVKEVSLVRLANERTADPAKLAESFSGLPCTPYNSVTELCQSMETLEAKTPVLITGSLFLVGEMLARRQGLAGEYELNERLEKSSVKK